MAESVIMCFVGAETTDRQKDWKGYACEQDRRKEKQVFYFFIYLAYVLLRFVADL